MQKFWRPTYVTGMSNFDPTQQRGHASNSGRWKAYENSAPEAGLGTTVIDRADEQEARERLEMIERTARRFVRSYRMSDQTREDIVQDTAFDLLNQQKLLGLDSVSAAKLINVAVRAVAQRHIDPNVRHEDLTARALLKKVVAAEERRLGRELTSFEKKQHADDIRENVFEPGRRPGVDFWIENREFSIDKPVSNADGMTTTFGDLLTAEELDAPFASDDSSLADLVDGMSIKVRDTLVDGTGAEVSRLTASQVRKDAWNHLAHVSDAPQAMPGTFTKAERKAASAIVAAGGAAELARAWQLGDTGPAQDAALFAPFGDLDIRAQERVVDQLLRKPEYATELWESAADIAARPAAG